MARGLVATRSQAESFIKLGEVQVDGQVMMKPGFFVVDANQIKLTTNEQYVSRAALKLASAAATFQLDFKDKVVLDVGSSTGGFTQYALQHGARKLIDVEVGTNQLHPSLRTNPKIELHEQTDIRQVKASHINNKEQEHVSPSVNLNVTPDIVVIDVSFISLRKVLPHIAQAISGPNTLIVAMAKPQFEATANLKHKGVIKNERIRREILKSFEIWATQYFVISDKSDSQVSGAKGNRERFYVLRRL